jgi:hypothetical protein
MFSVMEGKDMQKGVQDFDKEVNEGNTKGVIYKQDHTMEGLIRFDFLKEKYGEERIMKIMESNSISISDLSDQNKFSELCEIAESNI